jgi:hypothetical protein
MTRIDERLRAGATVLAVLDRRRIETGDPNLGSAIEDSVLDSCLIDLEWDLFANPPDLQSLKTPPPR